MKKETIIKKIEEIKDKKELIKISKALENYKELYNISKLYEGIDFDIIKANEIYSVIKGRIELLNKKEIDLESLDDIRIFFDIAIKDIHFNFTKISTSELKIVDIYKDAFTKVQEEMKINFDNKDPNYISLFRELQRILRNNNIENLTALELEKLTKEIEDIYLKAKRLNNNNEGIMSKYKYDKKFVRVHKRVKESFLKNISDIDLNKMLMEIKTNLDGILLKNINYIDNENYMLRNLHTILKKASNNIINIYEIKELSKIILNEYIEENKGIINGQFNQK